MKQIIRVVAATALIVGLGLSASCNKQPSGQNAVPAAPAQPPVAAAPAEPPQTISMSPSATIPANSSEVRPTTAPAIAPAQTTIDESIEATVSKSANFLGLIAPKPATWMWQPTKRMFAVSEYVVPGRGDADQARLTIFQIGGTPQANIERWTRDQFRAPGGGAVEPKVQQMESGGLAVVYAELSGEYRGMGAPSFTADRTLLGAIIPDAPGGQAILYLVGPTPTVEANRQYFLDMIKGIRKAEPQK